MLCVALNLCDFLMLAKSVCFIVNMLLRVSLIWLIYIASSLAGVFADKDLQQINAMLTCGAAKLNEVSRGQYGSSSY